ncbi:flagellar motor protein MotB [Litorivivens sp.]|uniref:flagellar motor protein MotB n=2 Tax=Litorivivens sp. TaxID=2020868 RepID=UPI00356AB6DD
MEDAPVKKAQAGAPAWVMTFADLMSLLLAFFVLLFSFSEMDKQKFKELSGSMRDAFGVQREVPAFNPPIGTSVIARDFSPGMPTPTDQDQVRQEAIKELTEMRKQGENEEAENDLLEDLEKVLNYLEVEIAKGVVEVQSDGERVITIRIRETGSFPSGSADLSNDFNPVILKIARLTNEIGGRIAVAGHTDIVPISTDRYRSNWELSSARAVTVLEQIVEKGQLDPARFQVAGFGATRPIDSNDTAEGRARNRRVEVILLRGGSLDTEYAEGVSREASAIPDQ